MPMLNAANLIVDATVRDDGSLAKLESQLENINKLTIYSNELSRVSQAQYQIKRNQLAVNNSLMRTQMMWSDKEIQNLGVHNALNQQLTYQTQNRLKIATDAATLRMRYSQEGIIITQQEAVVAVNMNNEIIASENAKIAAYNNTRKALMGVSISMFVMNISIGQMISSLKPLVKGNEAATKAIEQMQAVFALSMAPMQAFMSVQMIMTSTTMTLTQALTLFGGAMLFSIGLMGAITSKSWSMRAAFSALAAVGTFMAATQFMASIATMTLSGAMATLQAVMGNPMALAMLAIGVGATAFAVGTIISNKEKAQTLTGHRKRVRKGGMAELDDDEVVQRVSKDGTKGGGGDTHIYLPDSYNGSMSDAKITANSVRQMLNTGYGTIKYQRKVVTSG